MFFVLSYPLLKKCIGLVIINESWRELRKPFRKPYIKKMVYLKFCSLTLIGPIALIFKGSLNNYYISYLIECVGLLIINES